MSTSSHLSFFLWCWNSYLESQVFLIPPFQFSCCNLLPLLSLVPQWRASLWWFHWTDSDDFSPTPVRRHCFPQGHSIILVACIASLEQEMRSAPLKLRVLQLLSVSETSHFFLWCRCPHLLRKMPHLPEETEYSMVSLNLSFLHTPGAHWGDDHLNYFPPPHMSPLLPVPERSPLSFIPKTTVFPIPRLATSWGWLTKQMLISSYESALLPTTKCTGGSDSKESACNVGDLGFGPWIGKIPWRRAWQLTTVFLPGEFHGQRTLVGYSPSGCKESDTTEWLTM